MIEMIDSLGEYGEEVYGVSYPVWKTYVNLELIWQHTKDEKNFIDVYSRVFIHEFLHVVINNIIYEMFSESEEIFVDELACSDDLDVGRERLFEKW